jgi:Ca2+-binding EF-hand superfamily protein
MNSSKIYLINRFAGYFFPASDAEAFRKEVFSTFDPAKKNWIEFSEFVQAINILSTRKLYNQLAMAFATFDKHNSGEIDREDMCDVIAYLSIYLGKDIKPMAIVELVHRIYEAVDKEPDMDLTKEEFLHGCLGCKELTALLQSV